MVITLNMAYLLTGMNPFDATVHAMTTMSTGGFSTRDGSVGGFGVPAYEWTIGTFMFIASINYGLFYIALRKKDLGTFWRNIEFKTYIGICALSVVLLTLDACRVVVFLALWF